jgi:hypothetical protein
VIKTTKNQAFQIWNLLDDGFSVEAIKEESSLGNHTVERFCAIVKEFKKGTPSANLATPEWSIKRVDEVRSWWGDYEREKHGWSLAQHRNKLIETAKRIRARIVNPELNRRPYAGQSIWFWGEQDWRIAPTVWLRLVAPSIEDEVFWGDDLKCLKSHLSKGTFMADYEALMNETSKLMQELQDTACSLYVNNKERYLEWQIVQDKIADYLLANFVPDIIPTPEIVAELPYTRDYCARGVRELSPKNPDLDNRYDNIEKMLQQLWNDLDPDVINFMIEIGKCERCSAISVP